MLLAESLTTPNALDRSITLLRWIDGIPRNGSPTSLNELRQSDAKLYLWRTWPAGVTRSEEHTSELQSLMRISYAVFCLKKKTKKKPSYQQHTQPTHTTQ